MTQGQDHQIYYELNLVKYWPCRPWTIWNPSSTCLNPLDPWDKGPSYQSSKFGGLEGKDQLGLMGTKEIHYSYLFWQLSDAWYF